MEADDPLLEWNRLNVANAENAVISAMFSSLLSTSSLIDRFSVWLLAGTGATAALLVANADKLVPLLGEVGFRVSVSVLVVSAIFGLLSKARAVQCQIGHENEQRIRELTRPILDKHSEDEEKISEIAEKRGLSVATDLDLKRIVAEFTKPFPRWVKWLMSRHLKKHAGDPQIAFVLPVRFYLSQVAFATLQVALFLAFICVSLVFVQEV